MLLPPFDQLLEELSALTGQHHYAANPIGSGQLVGAVEMNEAITERRLRQMGFERNPISAFKNIHNHPDIVEQGSFRKVGYTEHPRMQLHVMLFGEEPLDEPTYLYAHWEYRWDTDPIKHYRAYIFDIEEGVARARELLDEHNISYEPVGITEHD